MTSAKALGRLDNSSLLRGLEKVVTIGQLLKTLASLLIAFVVGCLALYQHFAKTSELDALKCSVVDQNTMNNEMVHAAGEVRAALTLLQANLDKPAGDASSKELTSQLSRAITNIERSLGSIAEVKKKLETQSITGVRKC